MIYTSTHGKLMQLILDAHTSWWIYTNDNSYSLDLTQSRSYMTLPCLFMFKEELTSPSTNTLTWHLMLTYNHSTKVNTTSNQNMIIFPSSWSQNFRSHEIYPNNRMLFHTVSISSMKLVFIFGKFLQFIGIYQ